MPGATNEWVMAVFPALSRWTLTLLSSVALCGAPGCAPKTVAAVAKVALSSARAATPQAVVAATATATASASANAPLAAPPPPTPAASPAVDCPGVDATQQPLGQAAYPLEGLNLAPGKPLPPLPLPNELFRVPLQWPATSGGLMAIGFEVPGDAGGLAFVYRGCLLNTWFYSFGGNGVELTLHPAMRPIGHPALLLIEAGGLARGYYPNPETSEDHVESSLQPRWLVFAVDEARARLLVDSDDFSTLSEEPISLAATATSVSLVVGLGAAARRFRYDSTRETFSGLSALADKR
jgi:hypothetical protein